MKPDRLLGVSVDGAIIVIDFADSEHIILTFLSTHFQYAF